MMAEHCNQTMGASRHKACLHQQNIEVCRTAGLRSQAAGSSRLQLLVVGLRLRRTNRTMPMPPDWRSMFSRSRPKTIPAPMTKEVGHMTSAVFGASGRQGTLEKARIDFCRGEPAAASK